jgi:predicted Zn-dependent protease
MTATIALIPIAIDEEDKKNTFDPLTSHLASITILADMPQLDSFRVLFNEQMNQLNSDKTLYGLATSIMNHIKPYDSGKTIILAICNIDAYSLGLNFVFGQASLTGGVASIYLPRLRQESIMN